MARLGGRKIGTFCKRLTRWVALFWCATAVYGQEIGRAPHVADSPLDRPLAELRHVNLTSGDTSHGSFTAITQSPDGFLWLGSSVGLLRFDGVRFDDTYAARLPSLGICSLFADVNGDIWAGYYNGGLSRIRGNQITSFRGGTDVPQGMVYTVLRGPDDHLWAASTHGITRMVGKRWTTVGAELGFEGTHPHSMQMIDGVLWIADNEHAWFLKPGAPKFEVMAAQAHIDAEWRRTGTPSRPYDPQRDAEAFVDSSGALWISEPKGIERDRWIVGSDGQRTRVAETFSSADGLSSNGVLDFFEDREGSVWAVTRQGLDQFRATNLRPLPLPGNLQLPFIVPDGGKRVWVPNVWQSPFLVDGTTATLEPRIASGVLAAVRDRHGVVWMAGEYGVSKIDAGKVSTIAWPPVLKHAGGMSQAIAVDEQGTLWVSVVLHGLYKFKDGAWTEVDTSAYGNEAPARLLVDAFGRFWQVYLHGTVVAIAQGKVTRYGPADGLGVGALQAIEVTRSQVWLGGEHGLFLLHGDRFIRITGRGGDPFRVITGIVELDNGDLWLNALDGAYRITAAELAHAQGNPSYEVAYDFFGQDDGRVGLADRGRPLPTLGRSDDGRLWFSTPTALSWIAPQRVARNMVAPTVVIAAVSDGDRRYPASGDIVLPPLTRRATIEYTAASLANPKRVKFRYRLDGIDNDWQSVGDQRVAFYTNLGPGHYRFHVQAINEDGVASDRDADVGFVIRPAWYQTNSFKALCALLTLSLFLLAHWWRMKRERSRLLMVVAARNDERDRIARDLHDTLLQSVQGLVMHFQSVAERMPEEQSDRVALERVLDSADRVVAEARGRVLDLRSDTQEDLHEVLEQTGRELTLGQAIRRNSDLCLR